MRRREFITLLGGAAVAQTTPWRGIASAQQPARTRRVGVLMNIGADDPDAHDNIAAFRQSLGQRGWTDGRNVQIDIRWGGAMRPRLADTRPNWSRSRLTSLLPPAPRAWIRCCRPRAPCRSCSRTSLTRSAPAMSTAWRGRAATPPAFIQFEYTLSGKWLELLKQIAPRVTRVAVLRDSAITAGIGQFAVIQSVAPSLGMDVSAVNVRDASEIERGVAAFARTPNGGLMVTASALATIHRKLIIALAAQHKLPAIYYRRYFAPAEA